MSSQSSYRLPGMIHQSLLLVLTASGVALALAQNPLQAGILAGSLSGVQAFDIMLSPSVTGGRAEAALNRKLLGTNAAAADGSSLGTDAAAADGSSLGTDAAAADGSSLGTEAAAADGTSLGTSDASNKEESAGVEDGGDNMESNADMQPDAEVAASGTLPQPADEGNGDNMDSNAGMDSGAVVAASGALPQSAAALTASVPGLLPASESGLSQVQGGPHRRLVQSVSIFNGAFSPNGDAGCKVNPDGSVAISLSTSGGSGFTSRRAYPYGKFSVQAKLPPGYTAGVCSCFFLINGDYNTRGEWDFEFLGSATDGSGMTLQTNYFQGGVGQHEVLTSFGFDPTADFHTYTIDWQPQQTVFSVDGSAIRTVANTGSGYPKDPMTVAVSIWDASQWATGPRDDRIPVNYSYAPFTATFKDFEYIAYGNGN